MPCIFIDTRPRKLSPVLQRSKSERALQILPVIFNQPVWKHNTDNLQIKISAKGTFLLDF